MISLERTERTNTIIILSLTPSRTIVSNAYHRLADTKPTKPAIKSSTLPRMSSQERERHKPTPPPKPAALVAGQYVYRDLALTPEMYNQLRGLQKKAKDLRQDVKNLRRLSQSQAHTVRETIRDTFITIRAMLLSGGDAAWAAGDAEKVRLSREEDLSAFQQSRGGFKGTISKSTRRYEGSSKFRNGENRTRREVPKGRA